MLLVDPLDTKPGTRRGEIELVRFLGSVTRLDVRVDGDSDPVFVDVVSDAARDLATGQPVNVAVPPSAIRLHS